MSARSAQASAPGRRNLRQATLLAGVSAVALAMAPSALDARSLNGGMASGGVSAPNVASDAAAQAARQAATQAQQTQQSMARAARALQDMQSTQAAARAAAQAAQAAVTNGLGMAGGLAPGLVPDNGLVPKPSAFAGREQYEVSKTWQGISGLSQIRENGRTIVDIDQNAPKAIANWQSFNVGKETTLNFNQADSSYTILNRVASSIAPSQILGNINARGTVLVVNQNGIIFGGASQINVGSLTASALSISNERFLSSYITAQWNQSAPTFAADAGTIAGDVHVRAGARIETLADGSVVLLGGNITNDGTIKTPRGQTLLGAGQQAYLAASTDAGMRGLKIEFGGSAGAATSNGLIVAERGNITLAGRDVAVGPGAVLQSSTAVTANGSITLQARDDARRNIDSSSNVFLGYRAARLGDVTVGDRALLEILPDFMDTQTVTATELIAPSSIDVNGRSARVGRDATLIATSGAINVSVQSDPLQEVVSDSSKIYIDTGAILDVSGTLGVKLAMERNFIEVELRGNELKDSPLLKNSFLYGAKVWIDIRDKGTFTDPLLADLEWFKSEQGGWYGSSLFDASGWIAGIQRGLGELTSTGGTITLSGRGEIVQRAGSQLNVSGGTLTFADGYGRVTNLVGADGRRTRIGAANPAFGYVAFAGGFTRNHERWNVSETWTSIFDRMGTFERGYIEGQRAGTINVVAPRIALDGDIIAATTAGERQRARRETPKGGTLILGDADASVLSMTANARDYVLNEVRLQKQAVLLPESFVSDQALSGNHVTVLSTDKLNQSGIDSLSLSANKAIVVAEDADLDLGQKGTLALTSSAITVDGRARTSGGDIRIVAGNTLAATAPRIAIGGRAVLDTSGAWVNALIDRSSMAPVDGGAVTIRTSEVSIADDDAQVNHYEATAIGTVVIADGALIDVSGGGEFGFDRELGALGNAGRIFIGASDVDLSSAARLQGYALATANEAGRGGSLTLVGRGAQLHLNQGFLTRGGFASYAMGGVDELNVAAGQRIVLAPQNRLLSRDYTSLASGVALERLGALAVLPEGIRAAASLKLSAGVATYVSNGVGGYALSDVTGAVVLGEGSLIDAGIGGTVTLAAADLVQIDGRIVARGGSISAAIIVPGDVTTNIGSGESYDRDDRAIWLGARAQLDVSAALLPSWNAYGWRTGELLAGGTVTLDAAKAGSVVSETGSLIDVSGGSTELDLRNYATGGIFQPKTLVRAQTVWSNAGSVSVLARDGAWLDGAYNARAVSPLAEAGNFQLVLGERVSVQNSEPSAERFIELRQSRVPALPDGSRPGDSLARGRAYLSADLLMEGGFGAITLQSRNEISFMEDVTLSASGAISLIAPGIRIDSKNKIPGSWVWNDLPELEGWGPSSGFPDFGEGMPVSPDMIVDNCPWYCTQTPAEWAKHISARIAAPNVVIGALTEAPLSLAMLGAAPTTFIVDATRVLSFGLTTELRDVGTARFLSGGDIRLGIDGRTAGVRDPIGATLATAGDLTFRAAQVYPASGKVFAISSTGADATIAFLPGDATAPQPWSVGGSLTVSAQNIRNEGVLRAPLGQITLDAGATGTVTLASGSVVDVSAHGRSLPYGSFINGEWYDDSGSTTLTAMPAKKVTLNGNVLDIQAGASLDLSGGGDMSAYEFLPGTGGSRNVLSGEGVYAVLPGAQAAAAPISTAGSGAIAEGSSVYLSGVPDLAAGWYTLLPAEYALQPGAFRVQVAGAINDVPVGLATARADGGYLVSGWHGSSLTGSRDARTSGFIVMSAEAFRRYSEFTTYSANTVFADAARKAENVLPPLGIDAGQLVLSAISGLNLNGRMNLTAGEGGRGGLIDIASSSIAVVKQGEAPVAGFALTISGGALTGTGAQSLLLGGTRSPSIDGYVLNVTADRILVANDAASALVAPELLFATKSSVAAGGGVAGTGSIVVAEGAVLRAEGTYAGETLPLLIGNQLALDPLGTGMGSLLAVSNAAELVVRRFDIAGPGPDMAGSIDVRAGATLTAGSAILFDATANSTIANGAIVRARSLEVASSTVNFGDAPAGTTGFVANAATLAAFGAAERLVLRSYGVIDFYSNGSFDIRNPQTGLSSVRELVFDAGALRQRSAGDVALGARQVTLRNTSGTASTDTAATGTLFIAADQFNVGNGTNAILGFGRADINAGAVVLAGEGSLTAGGDVATDLTLRTALVTTATGADQALAATGALVLLPGAGVANPDALIGNGGRLALRGDTVTVATRVRLPAGALTLDAVHDVAVSAGAALDVSGRDQWFFDQVRTLPAGSINLTSQSGNVRVDAGALIDLTDSQGGGTLGVTVPEGSFDLRGSARGGSFVLDAKGIPGFALLQAALNDGGFAISRQLRLRTGDIVIDGVTRTRSFTLSADEGSITVTGLIDASGITGGKISLSAAGDVILEGGSQLTVAGQNFDGAGKGGSIFLSAGAHRVVNGADVSDPDAVLDIRPGAFIDLGVASAGAAARQIALNGPGSTIALPIAASISFPNGTPGDNRLMADSAGTITRADGSTVRFAAGESFALPPGASIRLDAAGTVSVASGSGGPTTVALPLSGAFQTSGATSLTAVPVTLDAAGSQIVLAGGAPVLLPNGTPGDDIITTDANSFTITTLSAGSRVTLKAGQSSLALSAGSSITLADALPTGASIPIENGQIHAEGSTVTLVRAGSTVGTASNGSELGFINGLPAGADLTVPSSASSVVMLVNQPYGTVGNRVTIGGSGAFATVPAGADGRLYFPDGTPQGVALSGAGVRVFDASGTLVRDTSGQSGNFTVPAGGWISQAGGSTVNVVQGSATFSVMTQSAAGSGVESLRFRGLQRIEDLTAGAVIYASGVQMSLTGSTPVSFLSTSNGLTLSGASVTNLGVGASILLPTGGTLAPINLGANVGVSLDAAGRFTASNADLGKLTAGTSLALGQAGTLSFASGTGGAIPLLMSASTNFSVQGASLFALGGAQAGTLHLRAPQTSDGTDLRIAPIRGTVSGAASIIAEGFKVYNLTGTDGVITQDLKDRVKLDAGAFASHSPAIKGRLLATNPGLASTLTVTPGVEIVNATDQPASVEALLTPNGILGLPSGTPVTLPAGFAGLLTAASGLLEIVTAANGASIVLDRLEQSVTVPAGAGILLPDGAPAWSFGFTLPYGTSTPPNGLIILPDGRQMSFNANYNYGGGYYEDLPPGTRILFSEGAGTINLAWAASSGVRVVLPAGTFRLGNAIQITSLPQGSTVASLGGSANVNISAAVAVPVIVPSDGEIGTSGLSLMAPAGAPALLTLRDAGVSQVSVAAGTALTLSQGGLIAATAAGGIYVNGTRVQSFAAGDTVNVPLGAQLRLDSNGSVTTQSANLRILVQAGAAYSVAGTDGSGGPAVVVAPSSVSGDIVLKANVPSDPLAPIVAWDLSGYRFGPDNVPGILTLRAAGNVRIEGSLSDGFQYKDNLNILGRYFAQGALIDDRSWSYNLVGGADLAAANALSVRPLFQVDPLKGNVLVNAAETHDTVVRTGTGDIAFAASRDIKLNSFVSVSGTMVNYASVYTAGRPANLQAADGATIAALDGDAFGRRGLSDGAFWMTYGGGDIRLTAGQDITGNTRAIIDFKGAQEISDWVRSQGEIGATGFYSTVHGWGVAPEARANAPYTRGVRDAVASLGGGNVVAEAARDVVDTTLAAANSGMYVGSSPQEAFLQTVGGGDVRLVAGRDTLGALVYVASGAGTMTTGRDLGPSGSYATRLALGDATIDATARRNTTVGTIYTPTLLYSSNNDFGTAWFSTYTDATAVRLQALVGDVRINTIRNNSADAYNMAAFNLLPGNVEAVAYHGSITIGGAVGLNQDQRIDMLPARGGDLSLLAADDITFNAGLGMSDADPLLFRTPVAAGAYSFAGWLGAPFAAALSDSLPYDIGRDRALAHSASLYRGMDANPVRLYAVGGDIVGAPFSMSRDDAGNWTGSTNTGRAPIYLSFPKSTVLRAGRDIVDLAMVTQNLREDQTSIVQAGRDLVMNKIIYMSLGRPEGGGIWVGGPGRLEVLTGRDLALNRSEGIMTLGNQLNPYLPANVSASVSLLVGMGAERPDYAGFAARYLAPGAVGAPWSYTDDLVAFVRAATGDGTLDATAGWARFATLPKTRQEEFIRSVYYKELIRTGTNGVTNGGNYNQGYEAVAALFPAGRSYGGDLSLGYSQIKSVYSGGIDMLVQGDINGGLAVVGPDISEIGMKTATQLGVVAQGGGNVNIAVDRDLIVNQSRVFTLGGDMLVWSSYGDIDAGKGAKTAQLAPPPRLVFNPANGTFALEFTGAASGSGIGTLITGPGQSPRMWLFAPGGTIDTGDAGIRANDLVIGALQIRGLDNLSITGVSTGVPVAVAPNTSALTAASNLSAAAQQAQPAQAPASNAQPSVIIVEVLGYGGGNGRDEERDDERSKRERQGSVYDPNGMLRVLGNGPEAVAQAGELTTAEREALSVLQKRSGAF